MTDPELLAEMERTVALFDAERFVLELDGWEVTVLFTALRLAAADAGGRPDAVPRHRSELQGLVLHQTGSDRLRRLVDKVNAMTDRLNTALAQRQP